MKRWHVIYTRPRSESLALQHLKRQGFTAYLPRHRKQRRHARRADLISAPLFPRYMFVLIDAATASWWSIRSTIGVNAIINTRASVDHDCVIGGHVHIAPGVVLGGGITIGVGSHIGAGSSVIQNIRIGENALVAAGASVVTDFPDGANIAGVPAKVMGK